MMKLTSAIAALATASLLCGCSFGGLLGSSPPATFDLIAPAIDKAHGTRTAQLTITPPVAVKTIDTDEVLIKGLNGRVGYYPGVAWGDRLPRLFQARLVETLANSGAFRAVLTNQDRVSGDISLAIEIRDFEVEVAPNSRDAVVDVYVKLVDDRSNAVLTTKRFQAHKPVQGDDPGASIAALNGAFQEVALEITSWVARRSA